MEEHKASDNMQKFFVKLLALKGYIKKECEKDPKSTPLKNIYQQIDQIIKSTEEKK